MWHIALDQMENTRQTKATKIFLELKLMGKGQMDMRTVLQEANGAVGTAKWAGTK